jgi:vacuolar-type H+-ATPase subunit E/Vma4
MNLYQLSNKYEEALMSMLNQPELPSQAILDTSQAFEGEIKIKATDIGALMINLDAQMDAMKEAIERMKSRLKTVEKQKEWLSENLKYAMEKWNITEISSPEFSIKIAKNPPALIIDEELEIPPDYFVTKIEHVPDKNKIKEALMAGKKIGGVTLKSSTRLIVK